MADDDGNYDDDGDDEYWQEEGYSNWLSGNEDEHGFDGYQVSTIDPSPAALLITFLLSILAIVLIPFCVAVREKYKKERFRRQLRQQKLTIQNGTRNDNDTNNEWTPYVAPTDPPSPDAKANESVEVWHENTQEFLERVKQGAKRTSTKIRAKKQQESKHSLSMNDTDTTGTVRDGLLKTTPNTPISLRSLPSRRRRTVHLLESSFSQQEEFPDDEEEFSDEDDASNADDHILKYYGLDNEMPGGNSIELQFDMVPGEKPPNWWTKLTGTRRQRGRGRLQGAAKVVNNSLHILEPRRMVEREPLLFERAASKQQEEPTLPWPLNDPQGDSSKRQLEVDVNSNPVQQDMEPSTSYVNDMMQEMGIVNHDKDPQTTNDDGDDNAVDEIVQAVEEDLLFDFDDELSQESQTSSYRQVRGKPGQQVGKKIGSDVDKFTPSTKSSEKQGTKMRIAAGALEEEEVLENVELIDVPRSVSAVPSTSPKAQEKTTKQKPIAAATTTSSSSSSKSKIAARRSFFLGSRSRKQQPEKTATAGHRSMPTKPDRASAETRVPTDPKRPQEPELAPPTARQVLIQPSSPNSTTLVPVDRAQTLPDRSQHAPAEHHDYIKMPDEGPTGSNTKEPSRRVSIQSAMTSPSQKVATQQESAEKLVKTPSGSAPSDKADLKTPQQTPLATDGYYVLMDGGDDQNNEATAEMTDMVPRSKKKVDVNLCCGKRPWWRFLCSRRFRRKVSKCATWDAEMDALLGLAMPFTLHTIVEHIFGLMEVAVIGRMLGTQSLAAFYSVSFIYTLSTMLMEGAHTSLFTLCSHAIGAKRYYLAGQMVQLSAVIYQVMLIPFAITFVYFLEDIVEWLGFDEQVADMAYRYAILVYAAEFINPLDEGLYYLLDVTGHEVYAALMALASASTSFVCVLCVGLFSKNPSLRQIGMVHLAVDAVFFILNVCLIYRFKWFDKYWAGMLDNFALANKRVVRLFLKQAVPLSLGYVMAYGEWEVLFVFAGYMGPAEVAVWGLLGDIWESLEEIGLATADAAEVRVANLLGSDQPQRARYCAHKSVVVSTLVAILCSVPIYACSKQIPSWFTKDETLQEMFKTLIPYACLGNVTMMFGSVSWTLLGAQGRFGLATAMGFIGSWGVTLPLSAISTLVLGYDLQGLASSVVIGYACSGALNSYFLVRSNWEKLSLKIQRKNRSEEKKFQSKSLKKKPMEETEKEYIPQPMNLEDLDWNELPAHGTSYFFLIC